MTEAGQMMIGVYEVVMTVLLLFPWVLVGTVVVGATWSKASSAIRRRAMGDRRGRPAMPWASLRPAIHIRSGETT